MNAIYCHCRRPLGTVDHDEYDGPYPATYTQDRIIIECPCGIKVNVLLWPALINALRNT